MNKSLIWILVFAWTVSAFGQAARYDYILSTINNSAPLPGGLYPMLAIPGAAVSVCAFPATGNPCTNTITTYTDSTLVTSCPSAQQLTPAGGGACTKFVDNEGGYGFWYSVATNPHIQYTITTTYGNFGPYDIAVPAGAICYTTGCTIGGPLFAPQFDDVVYASQYTSLNAAVAACPLGGGCTVVVSGPVPLSGPLTILSTTTLAFDQPGSVVLSSFTLTVNGTVIASPYQIFTGSGTVAGLRSVDPEWIPGNTLLAAIDALATTGGTVDLQNATYQAGMGSTTAAVPSVVISGSGQAQYNSTTAPTAFVSGSGTIVQGAIAFNGQSGLVVHDLSIDVGNTFNHCDQGGLFDSPSTISAGQTSGIHFYNLSILGCSQSFAPSSIQHDVLVENSNGVVEDNITTREGYFGNVLKATNSKLSKLDGAYHFGNCDIVKSDDLFGISTHVQYTDVKCDHSLAFSFQTFGATLNGISVKGIDVTNATTNAISVFDGEDNISLAPGVSKNIQIENAIIDTTGDDALSFDTSPGTGASSNNISIVNLTASNVTGSCVEIGIGVTGGTQVDTVTCNNATISGVYSFDPTSSANHIKCFSVADPCVFASGAGVVQASDVESSASALTGSVAGGVVLLAPNNSTGSVSGQANGVIPLATGATAIGAQSHLDDGVTTSATITSSEPIVAPRVSTTGSTTLLSAECGTGQVSDPFHVVNQTGGTRILYAQCSGTSAPGNVGVGVSVLFGDGLFPVSPLTFGCVATGASAPSSTIQTANTACLNAMITYQCASVTNNHFALFPSSAIWTNGTVQNNQCGGLHWEGMTISSQAGSTGSSGIIYTGNGVALEQGSPTTPAFANIISSTCTTASSGTCTIVVSGNTATNPVPIAGGYYIKVVGSSDTQANLVTGEAFNVTYSSGPNTTAIQYGQHSVASSSSCSSSCGTVDYASNQDYAPGPQGWSIEHFSIKCSSSTTTALVNQSYGGGRTYCTNGIGFADYRGGGELWNDVAITGFQVDYYMLNADQNNLKNINFVQASIGLWADSRANQNEIDHAWTFYNDTAMMFTGANHWDVFNWTTDSEGTNSSTNGCPLVIYNPYVNQGSGGGPDFYSPWFEDSNGVGTNQGFACIGVGGSYVTKGIHFYSPFYDGYAAGSGFPIQNYAFILGNADGVYVTEPKSYSTTQASSGTIETTLSAINTMVEFVGNGPTQGTTPTPTGPWRFKLEMGSFDVPALYVNNSTAGNPHVEVIQNKAFSAAGTPLTGGLACNAVLNGNTWNVSDAASVTFGATYTSGGTITRPATCSYSGSSYAWIY